MQEKLEIAFFYVFILCLLCLLDSIFQSRLGHNLSKDTTNPICWKQMKGQSSSRTFYTYCSMVLLQDDTGTFLAAGLAVNY